MALEDGVRVKVVVPADIKATLKTPAPVQTMRERHVAPAPEAAAVKHAPRTIRVVEFDATGRRVDGGRP